MSDVVGQFESNRGPAEVWAVAEAVYDEAQSRLIILFGSSLRLTNPDRADEVFTAEWLPERDVLRKFIPIERAYDYAQELFAAWIVKVRRSIPKSEVRSPAFSPPRTLVKHVEL